MSASVLTAEEAQGANITLAEEGKGLQAVHDVVIAMRAARRSGTANTKTRSEVRASSSKPWRQKGTGRARAGTVASPIWRGGGVVFGPKPRDYSKTVPKRTKRLAFRRALTERIAAEDVLLTNSFAIEDGKTKTCLAAVRAMTDAKKVMVVSSSFDEKTYLAGRNLGWVQLMTAAQVNTEDLLYFDKIIVTADALETIAGRTVQ